MPERPIYFTKPDQEEEMNITPGEKGCITLFAGGFFGGIAGGASIIGGSGVDLRVGVEVGVGMSAFTGGIIMALTSSERAEKLAKEGRRRAYLEALKGCVESAIGLALAGGTAGYGVADIPGAVIGGSVGVLVGGVGFGQLAFARVSSGLREAQKLKQ